MGTLAAHSAIRRRHSDGSWDHPGPPTSYELTHTGRELAHTLESVDTWTAIYQRYLDDESASPS